MAATTPPQWLIIVHRDRRDLYAKLRRSFGEASLVEVTLDRRQGDRRRSGSRGATPDRRRVDRRRAPSVREPSPGAMYRLIQQGDGFHAFQAQGRMTMRCPECDVELEFEMPRFGEPPARLTIDVVHTPQRGSGAPHFIETEAFKATGRSLLACRILARRRQEGSPGATAGVGSSEPPPRAAGPG